MLVGRARVFVRHVEARPHPELDELALDDLPTDLVAEVLLGEAPPADLREHLLLGHGAPLLLLRLGGDVRDSPVDFIARNRDVRFVRLLLLQPVVDHALEQLAVHLLLLNADDIRVVRLRADLHACRRGAVQDVGPEDRALADDGHDALDDGRARGRRSDDQGAADENPENDFRRHHGQLL